MTEAQALEFQVGTGKTKINVSKKLGKTINFSPFCCHFHRRDVWIFIIIIIILKSQIGTALRKAPLYLLFTYIKK